MARNQREAPPVTTAQRLGSIVKSVRDIMRRDKGLNGDADRLPMLTWILFLKFLDDLDYLNEETRETYEPILSAPYRWRDWAAEPTGITGTILLAFLNDQTALHADGTEGMGLFAYLRSLKGNADPRRQVVGNVFANLQNRMQDGYLLREVVNKVNGIHFYSTEEVHVLGNLYESLLKEMRDSAGDAGEFYTPRPVVKFMVWATNPKLGEHVHDPACGTGGFLVESFLHLKEQARTVEEQVVLQQSVSGVEAKGLPYLLAQMNLLLHGMESPQIFAENSLRPVSYLGVNLDGIGEAQRVDVILANPPFGGEEDPSVQKEFDEDLRTSETALLFLQLIMRRLKRRGTSLGRAAIVVPNGTLFALGVAARIKEKLLTEFNLHTIVRLPNGVFAPYTSIPANLLFFDTSGPTGTTWYYEHPLPEGRKNYSKTQPLQFEEFADLQAWWSERVESDRAWKVEFGEIYDAAKEKADPLREIIRTADAAIMGRANHIAQVDKEIKEAESGSLFAASGNVKELREERRELVAERQKWEAKRTAAKEAFDALWWPLFNLDLKNPVAQEEAAHVPPEQLVAEIIAGEKRILEIMTEIESALVGGIK
ncbi:N-6 DNA methylase [Armatimonas sp.]|uniref:class I SAM-dependent DNA methyltransferase n=1 Tax=Armatimonas sp. TaxID=1872638 RepID=UPI003751AE88